MKASGQTSLAVDRQATARALDAAEVPRPLEVDSDTSPSFKSGQTATAAARSPRKSESNPAPYPDNVRRPEATKYEATKYEATKYEASKYEASTAPAPVTVARRETSGDSAITGQVTSLLDPLDEPIEEIDPVDYLEAEVRKVDQHLARELLSDDGAPLFTHIVTGLVDLVTIAVTSMPFLALIAITSGSLSDKSTLVAAAILAALLAFFYLSLTQSLSGKTFGMMLTNTRVTEAATGHRPSVGCALVRSLCYPIALAPAGIGILWSVIDRRHRCWHDLLSGTAVVRDF
jgi:uncharacterized RDD family membrane protein YckC